MLHKKISLQNLKIAESSVFIFSNQNEGKHLSSGYIQC